MLSYEAKGLGNYCKNGRKGFDTHITRLQMQCYVVISDFEYRQDKHECKEDHREIEDEDAEQQYDAEMELAVSWPYAGDAVQRSNLTADDQNAE